MVCGRRTEIFQRKLDKGTMMFEIGLENKKPESRVVRPATLNKITIIMCVKASFLNGPHFSMLRGRLVAPTKKYPNSNDMGRFLRIGNVRMRHVTNSCNFDPRTRLGDKCKQQLAEPSKRTYSEALVKANLLFHKGATKFPCISLDEKIHDICTCLLTNLTQTTPEI